MVRRLIAPLLICILAVLPAYANAPTFPFKTYAEAKALQSSEALPACENGGVRVALGPEWVVFSWPDRDLFIHYKDDQPDYVYLTKGVINGTIQVVQTLTLSQAKDRFYTPCAYGDEKNV